MSFANPQLVTLMLLVVPATAGFFFWAWKQKQLAISKFVRSRLREQLTLGVSHYRQWVKSGLILAGLACVFVALARPRWGVGEEIAKAEGVDIVVCVDVSRSMQATDVSPSRLARAKLACYDLLHATGTDRLGLVAFAGGAFLQCPLTLDDDAFRQNVAALDTDSIPEQGTALGQAIDEAKAAFGQDAASQKAIIIVTDGEDHEPGAVTAAKDCASAGIRIFTIGVGSVAGELLKSTDPYGNSVFFKDEDGSPVKSRLNEELLRQIAESAGGFYLHLDNSDTMGELYRRAFANVAKTKFSTTTFRHWIERFQWPLGLGILLLAIEILIPDHGNIRSKHSGRHLEVSKPLPTTPPVPAVAAATTVALMLLLIGLPRAQASTGKAETQYQKGQFEGALAEYEKLAKENPDDPRLRFNAGASAYRSGDYKKAGGLFEQVLTAQDLKLQQQAWYNLGNTHFKLGEEAKEMDAKREQWNQALASYTAARKLDPQDPDAQHNYDTLKQLLDQIQPPPPQDQDQDKDKDKDKDKDQDKKKQDDKKDQQKQDQNKDDKSKSGDKDQQQQDKDQQGKDKKQENGDKKDGEKSQGQQSQKEDGKKEGEKNESQGKEGDPQQAGDKKPSESGMKAQRKEGQDPAAAGEARAEDEKENQAGRMSARQAMKMLDNQKGEEKAFVFRAARARGYTNGEPRDAREARRKAW